MHDHNAADDAGKPINDGASTLHQGRESLGRERVKHVGRGGMAGRGRGQKEGAASTGPGRGRGGGGRMQALGLGCKQRGRGGGRAVGGRGGKTLDVGAVVEPCVCCWHCCKIAQVALAMATAKVTGGWGPRVAAGPGAGRGRRIQGNLGEATHSIKGPKGGGLAATGQAEATEKGFRFFPFFLSFCLR